MNKINMVMPLAPNNIKENDYTYLNYGSDFYLGFIDSGVRNETKLYNKRGYRFSNFDIADEKDVLKLKQISKYKKHIGFKISLVLNNLATLSEINKFGKTLKKINKIIEIDNYIVQDIFFIDYISKNNDIKKPIHLSSLGMFANRTHFELLKKYPIIKRVILHRDIDEDSMFNIIEYIRKNNLNIELEYFAMNENCYNIDGLCYSLHKTEENNKPFVCFREPLYFQGNQKMQNLLKNKTNCHLCFISLFNKKHNIFNYINYFKIPGRGHDVNILLKYYNASIMFLETLKNKPGLEQEIKRNIMEKNFGKTYTDLMFCGNCYFGNKKV